MKTGNKLLDALSLGDGGVQVDVTRNCVFISTKYTPLVFGHGETLSKATTNMAKKVMEFDQKWHNAPVEVAAIKENFT